MDKFSQKTCTSFGELHVPDNDIEITVTQAYRHGAFIGSFAVNEIRC